MQKFPLNPKHPERICWGCGKLCPANDMCCGNGTIRAPHPAELMGGDWYRDLAAQERADLGIEPDEQQKPDANLAS